MAAAEHSALELPPDGVPGDAAGYRLVCARGELTGESLDLANADDPLHPLLGEGWASSALVLDMADAEYIDSAGIGWLIGVDKQAKQAGGRLLVAGLQPRVRQVLDTMRVDKVLTLCADRQEAIDRAGDGGPSSG